VLRRRGKPRSDHPAGAPVRDPDAAADPALRRSEARLPDSPARPADPLADRDRDLGASRPLRRSPARRSLPPVASRALVRGGRRRHPRHGPRPLRPPAGAGRAPLPGRSRPAPDLHLSPRTDPRPLRRRGGRHGGGPDPPAAGGRSRPRGDARVPRRLNPPADIAAALDAPHRDPDGTYFNPWRRFPVRFLDVLRWKLSPNPYRGAPKPPVPRVANDGAYLLRAGEPDSITWVGHSTFAIHDGGDLVLTDPHWGPRALVPPRLAPPGIPLEAAAGAKFAVLSHDHYDHLDAWTVRRLPAALPWFVPPGLGAWFRRRGRQAVELDWWQSARVGRFEITAVPVQHWSRRTFRPNRALWCGWMIESDHRRYFFA